MSDFYDDVLKKVKEIEKKYGAGSLIRLSDDSYPKNVPAVSTGSISLDHALGVGGLPFGRLVEILGVEMGGKSSLALHIVAESQKMATPIASAYIDVEHALDKTLIENIGVDLDKMWVSQPDCAEDALSLADELMKNGFRIIVIDSVAALTPRKELEGEMGDPNISLQARMMSQTLRRLQSVTSKYNSILIFINQLRENIKMGYGSGPSEVSPGGRALKYYASIRLDVRKLSSIKDGANIIGHRVKVKVIKNRVAVPFKEAEFDLIYGKGIDKFAELIDCAIATGIVRRSGSWCYYYDERIGQGRDSAKAYFLTFDEKQLQEFRSEVLKRLNEGKIVKSAPSDVDIEEIEV